LPKNIAKDARWLDFVVRSSSHDLQKIEPR